MADNENQQNFCVTFVKPLHSVARKLAFLTKTAFMQTIAQLSLFFLECKFCCKYHCHTAAINLISLFIAVNIILHYFYAKNKVRIWFWYFEKLENL